MMNLDNPTGFIIEVKRDDTGIKLTCKEALSLEELNKEKDKTKILEELREVIEQIPHTDSSKIHQIQNGTVLFIGKVDKVDEKVSKKGKPYAFINAVDLSGNIDCMVFEKQLQKLNSLNLEKPLGLNLEITTDDEKQRITCKSVLSLEEAKKNKNGKKTVINELISEEKKEEIKEDPTVIRLMPQEHYDTLEELYSLLKTNHGRSEVQLMINSKLVDIKMRTYIKINPAIKEEIEKLEGVEVLQ